MLNTILGIIYFIIAISIIVVVHEWGHMVVAKRNGVKCFEFSVGMGPVIWNFGTDKDGTEYKLRAIPLGGFVAMAGEEDSEDMNYDKEESLANKKPWQKIKILFAGAGMNFILGFVVLFLISFCFGVSQPQAGTAILVTPDTPAAEAGIESKDQIVAIDGTKVESYQQISDNLENKMTVSIDYLDVSENTQKTATIEKTALNCDEGVVGISPITTVDRFALGASLKTASIRFIAMFAAVGESLKLLVNGTAGVSDLMGPVGIASGASNVVSSGFNTMLFVLAFLSVNIGIVNLLPFPALDGGRIVLAVYELITRRRVPEKLELYLNLAGFVLLMGLFVIVTFADVGRLGVTKYYDLDVQSNAVCARDIKSLDYTLRLEPFNADERAQSLTLQLSVTDGQIASVDGQSFNETAIDMQLNEEQYNKIVTTGLEVKIDNLDVSQKNPVDLSVKIKDENNDLINQIIYRIER